MQQKKYSSIKRKFKKDFLVEGSHIIIQEKIDGANASFSKGEDGSLQLFSRNKQLDESDTLRGFYGWANEAIDPNNLEEGKVYFGEWTAKHKVDYGDNLQKFYLFDIYDVGSEKYIPFEQTQKFANDNGFNMPPLFYNGEFQSIDHIMSFVGKTELGGKIGEEEGGEGVVVKRYDYNDSYKFHKIVTEKFSEKKIRQPKEFTPTPEHSFVQQFATDARVEKILFKLFDEGVLEGEPEELDNKDIGRVMKHLVSYVREDIIKEESDEFEGEEPIDIKNMNKSLGGIVSKVLLKFINSL